MGERTSSFANDPAGSCPKCADLRREREALFDCLVRMQRQISELKSAMMARGAQRLLHHLGTRASR